MVEKLTGGEYFNEPLLTVQSHPDFSMIAFQVIADISVMTSEELENLALKLIGGKS